MKEFLGWIMGKNPYRHNDETGIMHAVIAVREDGIRSLCGTVVRGGQLEHGEKPPHGHACRRCLVALEKRRAEA